MPYLRWIVFLRYPAMPTADADAWFDKVAAPEIVARPGLRRFGLYRAVSERSEYPRVMELWFDSYADWRAAFLDPDPGSRHRRGAARFRRHAFHVRREIPTSISFMTIGWCLEYLCCRYCFARAKATFSMICCAGSRPGIRTRRRLENAIRRSISPRSTGVHRVANGLVASGSAGDRIAIVGRNSAEQVELLLGIARAGKWPCPSTGASPRRKSGISSAIPARRASSRTGSSPASWRRRWRKAGAADRARRRGGGGFAA
jgi:hypothetical protein